MTPHLPGRPRDAGRRRSRQRHGTRCAAIPAAAGIVLTSFPRRPGELLLTPADGAARCRSRKTEPPDSRKGRLTPACQGTPAASLGQPPILPSHHGRLPRAAQRARRLASSSGDQQLSRRAEGPASRDLGPWRTLPWHGGVTDDERARGRRGAAEPDSRTAQSRSARGGGGSSRPVLPGSPTMVVTSLPAARLAPWADDTTALPSTSTGRAPQEPSGAQPCLAEVIPHLPRSRGADLHLRLAGTWACR